MLSLLAPEDIARSLRTVNARIQRLRSPQSDAGLETSLRHSLTTLMWQELRRTMSARPSSGVLPDTLAHHPQGSGATWMQKNLETYISRRALQWQHAVLELLDRLESDWPQLLRRFGLGATAALRAISRPLGDLHNQGRSVFSIQFTDGRTLVYKPRPLEAEHAFGRLLDWFRGQDFPVDLASCRTLPGDGYGWAEYIEQTLCSNVNEARFYYRQQGGFLAVFWLLCAEDATSDNVVVQRHQPVWIDTECVCQPEIPYAFSSVKLMPDWITTSILTTGMVPCGSPDGMRRYQQGGLNVSCLRDQSQVFSNGAGMKAAYVQEIVRGFRETYVWILMHKQTWSGDVGPLTSWRNLSVRVLLRSTGFYTALIRSLVVAPETEKSRIRNDVEEALRSWDGHGRWSDPWPPDLVQAEMTALERGDVPYWTASVGSCDLREAGGDYVHGLASLSGMDRVLRRSAQIGRADLERQVWLIESFIGAHDQYRQDANSSHPASPQ